MVDRNKQIVIGALLLVLLGIGGFQFMRGGDTPTPAPKPEQKKEPAKTDAKPAEDPVKNPEVSGDLAQRDPFHAVTLTDPTVHEPTPTPAAPHTAPTRRFAPAPLPSGAGFQPMGVPGADKIALQPMASQEKKEPTFDYSLSGVVVGHKPVAVFKDSGGGQHLVPAGGSIDGDSSVVSVGDSEVYVKFRGKTLRLTMGGNPGGK